MDDVDAIKNDQRFDKFNIAIAGCIINDKLRRHRRVGYNTTRCLHARVEALLLGRAAGIAVISLRECVAAKPLGSRLEQCHHHQLVHQL